MFLSPNLGSKESSQAVQTCATVLRTSAQFDACRDTPAGFPLTLRVSQKCSKNGAETERKTNAECTAQGCITKGHQ